MKSRTLIASQSRLLCNLQRSLHLALALAIVLLLAACERPLQTGPDTGDVLPTDPLPTEVVPQDETPTPEPTVAMPEDEPTAAPATEPAPTETPETADESPRTDDGVTDEEEATEDPATEPTAEPTAEPTTKPTAEPTTEPTAEATPTGESEAGAERVHVVQPGENLYRIGLQYGISWTVLAEYNNLANANDIEVGQQIRIPPTAGGEGGATATPAPQVTHVVQPGETLFIISQQYGVSWPDIAAANNLVAPYTIHVGQTLVIPGE